ncbi:MAG: HAD-IIIA family hydrolase, partial [Chloroflexi bacterium]|nr:HAD-IIIA family hydrolase [Chloroflexota bacterium]
MWENLSKSVKHCSMSFPAIFLDRDGVIIENREDYVKSWNEVRFLTGALDALRCSGKSEYLQILVTNQSAVGRGIITLDQAHDINQRIIAMIESSGGRVDASYLCPHRPEEKCGCRKPAPGMLQKAKEEFSIDFERSYLIGDAASDIEAAQTVGIQGILVLTGRGEHQLEMMKESRFRDFYVAPDLSSAFDII